MNHDFVLGAAIQLIKDVRRTAQSGNMSGEPCTCLNIKFACDDWLKTYGTSNDTTVEEEGALEGGKG